MNDPSTDTDLGGRPLGSEEGAVFPVDAFSGLVFRTAVLLIDAGFLFGTLMVAAIIIALLGDPTLENTWLFEPWLLFSWFYLTVLKASSVRTLGYRLTGLRIVNLQGKRPSVFWMTFRLLLMFLGPFIIWIDLPWLASDHWKQSMRDKLARTYVIKKNAQPIGRGIRRTAYYDVMGYPFVCWEIRPRATVTPLPV